jgi:DNA-binding XRE family transcriptional regulator
MNIKDIDLNQWPQLTTRERKIFELLQKDTAPELLYKQCSLTRQGLEHFLEKFNVVWDKPLPSVNQEPLSDFHVQFGLRIVELRTTLRQERAGDARDSATLTRTELANEALIPTRRLAALEKGTQDITLWEILRLAEALGTTLTDMFAVPPTQAQLQALHEA